MKQAIQNAIKTNNSHIANINSKAKFINLSREEVIKIFKSFNDELSFILAEHNRQQASKGSMTEFPRTRQKIQEYRELNELEIKTLTKSGEEFLEEMEHLIHIAENKTSTSFRENLIRSAISGLCTDSNNFSDDKEIEIDVALSIKIADEVIKQLAQK